MYAGVKYFSKIMISYYCLAGLLSAASGVWFISRESHPYEAKSLLFYVNQGKGLYLLSRVVNQGQAPPSNQMMKRLSNVERLFDKHLDPLPSHIRKLRPSLPRM